MALTHPSNGLRDMITRACKDSRESYCNLDVFFDVTPTRRPHVRLLYRYDPCWEAVAAGITGEIARNRDRNYCGALHLSGVGACVSNLGVKTTQA